MMNQTQKHTTGKKLLALLLALIMTVSLLPMSVFAAEVEAEPEQNVVEQSTEPAAEDVTVEPSADGQDEDEAAEEPPADPAETVADPQAMVKEDAAVYAAADADFYRILHLDCGREYFTKDWIIALINEMAAAGYNQLQLAFGNGGFRFVLDDMRVGSYTSDAVKNAIEAGNEHYNTYGDGENGPTNSEWLTYTPAVNALTESEMDAIISHAQTKSIEIVPMFNTPGHMHALLAAMEKLGMSNVSISGKPGCLNLDNSDAVAFTKELLTKYVTYFASKGCKFFNLATDEYSSFDSTFYEYANSLIDIVVGKSMTPRVFNDGVTTSGSSIKIDSSYPTQVCFWYPNSASASSISSSGYPMINTNHDYYYVSTNENWNLNNEGYTFVGEYNEENWVAKAEQFSNTAFNAGKGISGTVNNPVGSMFCVWCNTPGKNDETAIARQIRMILRVMAARMQDSNTYSTSDVVVAGGFNADGTINGATTGDTGTDYSYEKTINVAVNDTATDTISGANYAGTYTTDDPSIATVEVTGVDETEATVTYTKVNKNPRWNTLISSDTTSATSYYYLASDGTYYQLYVTRSSSWFQNSYSLGYYANGSSTLTPVASATNGRNMVSNTVTLYTKSGTDGTPASTTVTFTGVAVGTTYVIVGNTRYTITVEAENLSNVVLPINLWITNTGVVPTGWSNGSPANFTYSDADGNRRSIYKLSAAESDVYSAEGIALSSILPDMNGTAKSWDKNTYNVVYWKSAYHTAAHRQSTDGWTNESLNGIAFTYIRYWEGSWAYSVDGTDWVTIDNVGAEAGDNDKNQVNIWYRQTTTITDEVETQIVDWGPIKYVSGQCLLDFAVKYESGERTPDSFPVSGKTMGFDCPTNQAVPLSNGYVVQDSDGTYYRTVYGIAGVETAGYEVYMITVTPSSDNHGTYINRSSAPSSYTYDGTEKVAWAKTEADAANSGLTLMTDIKYGGEPFLDKVSIYQYQGLLVTYYLRAKVTEDSLTVHYVDESVNTEFYRYVINVKAPTIFNEYIGLADPWKGPLNNGTVTNDKGKPQTVSADLSTMPSIGAQYRYSDYTCTRVVRSEDGKDVYLYYNFNNTKSFVIDFGLPLEIPLTALNESLKDASIISVTVTGAKHGNAVYDSEKKTVTYTLTSVLSEMESIGVAVTGATSEGTQSMVSYNVNIIPASTVYYEDSFVTFANGVDAAVGATWTTDGAETTTNQALEELGKHTNVYGYDTAYANSTTFSMGSARKVTVSAGTTVNPTATFTFKGTGFDIISLTDNTSGAISVQVYRGTTTTKENRVKGYIVNNYYGYEYNEESNTWSIVKPDENGASNALYQIPVMKVTGLDYGEYTAVITVAYDLVFDNAQSGKYSFWLDAIRVYDPMGADISLYEQDGEGYPQYIKLRNALVSGDATIAGNRAVFIDGAAEADITTYANYGPNNEVYLANGQAISFTVPDNTDIATVQIGAKAPSGMATMSVNQSTISQSLNTATEMYYDITSQAIENGTAKQVTITNTGSGILSLTNLKITFKEKQEGTVALATLSDEAQTAAVMTVRALFAAAPVEPEPEPTFDPVRFEAAWNRSTVRAGQKVTLTVKTSEDVEAVMVDGVTIDTYRTRTQRTGWGQNATKVTYREFTYTITAAETADYSITAVNAEGTASEAITATLTVQAASQRPGFGGWLDKIFGRWF